MQTVSLLFAEALIPMSLKLVPPPQHSGAESKRFCGVQDQKVTFEKPTALRGGNMLILKIIKVKCCR